MANNKIRGSLQIQEKSTPLNKLTTVPSFFVRVISVASNVILNGTQTVDGVALNAGDIVGCFAQTTTTQDGVYIVNAGGAWARSHLALTGYDLSGHSITVTEGTTLSATVWGFQNAQGLGVVGTDNLQPIQLAGGGLIGADNGLSIRGSDVILGGDLDQDIYIYGHNRRFDLSNAKMNFEISGGNRLDMNMFSGHSGFRMRNSSGTRAMEVFDNALSNGFLLRFDQDDARLVNTPSGSEGSAIVDVNYVHSVVQGRYNTARVMSDVNITLSGTQTIDGIAVVDGDTVYAGTQTTVSEDGLYIVRAGAWERQFGWTIGDEVAGITITVLEGTSHGDTKWLVTNNTGSDVIGTDDIIVSELTGAGNITAGSGLSWTGNTLNITASDLSMLINSDDIQVNIGNTNGASLEVSASGLELATTITGSRTFSDPLTIGAYTLPNTDGASGNVLITDGSGAVSWTDASTKVSEVEPEVFTLTGAASGEAITLSHLGTHATVKVARVKVFYEGQMLLSGAGNDYTIDPATGIITFIGLTVLNDTVQVVYSTQDA